MTTRSRTTGPPFSHPPTGRPPTIRKRFLQLGQNAFQAYYEHLPVCRPQQAPRARTWFCTAAWTTPTLANLQARDTRQYRSDQLTENFPGGPQHPGRADYFLPRTLTVMKQEQWLFRGPWLRPPARWNVIAQQTMMAQYDYDPSPRLFRASTTTSGTGYVVARNRLTNFIDQQALPANPVVLSGDWHSAFVNEVLL